METIQAPKPQSATPNLATSDAKPRRVFPWPAANWLFAFGLLLYLFTRLVALDKFPIYFFSDEAIQTMSAFDLINRGFRDVTGRLLPVYFDNGGQYNLSFSVYLQALIAWLPRSIWLTRGLPALVSVVFPLSAGLGLRDYFKARFWWLAPFVISALPAWFLHSRTAFETALGASLYALFLYFYLRYRLKDRKFLPLALLFGALAFYTYSPLQLVVVLTGVLLLIFDWHYHFADKSTLLRGGVLLALLATPYVTFRLSHPTALSDHLNLLDSYLVQRIPVIEKVGQFVKLYLQGLDPRYWFLPNNLDLVRHQMNNLGHLPIFLLPFIIFGLVQVFRKLKQPAWRVVLIALIAAPSGAALAGVAINRLLVVNVPAALLACLGLEGFLSWLSQHLKKPAVVALLIALLLSGFSLWMTREAIVNGPRWSEDYSLYGMQWGGKQVFDEVKSFLAENPQKQVTMSPSWANATDIIGRFFLGDPLPIQFGTIEAYTLYPLQLDSSNVFIMTPDEYTWMLGTGKFQDVQVIKTLPWPDGRTGFYFVTLRYVDNIQEIFKEEMAKRRELQKGTVNISGQNVQAAYSLTDISDIQAAFDGDPTTLLRSFEANPLRIELTFPQSTNLQAVTALVGSPPSLMEVNLITNDGSTRTFSAQTGPAEQVRPLTVTFDQVYEVMQLTIALSNLNEGEPAHVHLWELEIR